MAESGIQAVLPGVSLTICSRNRSQLLLETVRSVLQGKSVPEEIVIVDQSEVRHPVLPTLHPGGGCRVRYIQSDTVGVGSARNAALRAAQGDVLVLTDDDMLVAPDWLESLVGALKDAGRKSVVTGKVRSAQEADLEGFAPSIKVDDQPAVYSGHRDHDVLYTGNMAMRRAALDEIGLFDERLGAGARFPAAYDNDFGFRLLKAGYHIHYVPQAKVFHRAWRSHQDYAKLCWNYGRGQGAFYAKHIRWRDLYTFWRLLMALGRRVVFGLVHLMRGQFQTAIGDARYAVGLLSGSIEWLLTEKGRTESFSVGA